MRIHVRELLNGQDVPRGILGWIRGEDGGGGLKGVKHQPSAQGEINSLCTS